MLSTIQAAITPWLELPVGIINIDYVTFLDQNSILVGCKLGPRLKVRISGTFQKRTLWHLLKIYFVLVHSLP